MKSVYGKVVLITGASSGIGKAAAELLAKEGYKVYGTSRGIKTEISGVPGSETNETSRCPRVPGSETNETSRCPRVPGSGTNETSRCLDGTDETSRCPGFMKMIRLDVCSEKSVRSAVDYVIGEEGRIDILVNNAGFGIAGSVEDTSVEEAERQFATNFFGVHRMIRNVLPVMRKQQKGLIINISSVAGQLPIPFQSMYSASKYAVEALSEALRIEVRPFGVMVTVVEPGDTKTGFTGNRQNAVAVSENSVYRERFEKSIHTMIKDEQQGPEPEVVARVILKLTERKNPPVKAAVGFQYKLILLVKRFVPARFIGYVLSKLY